MSTTVHPAPAPHQHPPPHHSLCDPQGDSRLLQRSKRRWVITTLELEEEDPGPFPKFVGEVRQLLSGKAHHPVQFSTSLLAGG